MVLGTHTRPRIYVCGPGYLYETQDICMWTWPGYDEVVPCLAQDMGLCLGMMVWGWVLLMRA